jgi:branched-chain amino acid aminotransferase
VHRYLLHNDDILDAGAVCLKPGQVGLFTGWGVFSTLRVYDGVLFAFERHWARMQRDAKLFRVPFPADSEWIESRLLRLVEANGAQNGTVRVYLVRNKGGIWEGPGITCEFDLTAFTTDVKDWGEGVRLGVIPNARYAASPFAGTKILSWGENLTWHEEAHERGLDEVVLLNERGEVSECTSANIFAAFGDRVCTPPLSSGCLPGITREIVLSCSGQGYTVEERALTPGDLERADGVFITSTTRELLPVREIEGLTIRRGSKARDALQAAFSAFSNQYEKKRRRLSIIS